MSAFIVWEYINILSHLINYSNNVKGFVSKHLPFLSRPDVNFTIYIIYFLIHNED